MEIHQVAVGVGYGDAITSMMLEVRNALRAVVKSEIFAHHTDLRLPDILPLSDFPTSTSAHRLIVYHASMGEPAVTRFLLRRREPLVVMYHNITPSQFFVDSSVEVAALAEWGRRELTLLADRCVLAVAASAFNAEDLMAYGYRDVVVAPVGVDPDRLLGLPPDKKFAAQLVERAGPDYVLSVSQLFPHKRHELIVQAVHLLRSVHRIDVGLVIVGVTRSPAYRHAIDGLVAELAIDGVFLTGAISDRQLATAYAGAGAFVTASEHEGLALPPLEAMAFGVPVVARRFGALPATVGRAGIVLEATSGPRHIAEAVAEVLTNEPLRRTLSERGVERLRNWRPDRSMATFLDSVAAVL